MAETHVYLLILLKWLKVFSMTQCEIKRVTVHSEILSALKEAEFHLKRIRHS